MKTTSVGIENLCVQCHAYCRYCLLSSCGKTSGVSYERGKDFAKRFYQEMQTAVPDIHVFHYIGYSMDTPNLADYIRFSKEIKSPSASFLQMNGLRIRDDCETEVLVNTLVKESINEIDLTFYGQEEYHDRFAGRAGDFSFLLQILNAARERDLKVHFSMPVNQENLDQIERLPDILGVRDMGAVSVFPPHSKGRGAALDHLRLTTADRDRAGKWVREKLASCRTEGEWLSANEEKNANFRSLTLALTEDNISRFERMSAVDILTYLEKLDDDYYAAIPSAQELERRYGLPGGERIYRRYRDLYLEWQQKYIREFKPDLWDMNDETHHFSVRY